MVDEHFGINVVEFMVSPCFSERSKYPSHSILGFLIRQPVSLRCHMLPLGHGSTLLFLPRLVRPQVCPSSARISQRLTSGPFLHSPGFHADKNDEYVEVLQMIMSLDEEKQLAIRKEARARAVQVFSNEAFCRSWESHLCSRLKDSIAAAKQRK